MEAKRLYNVNSVFIVTDTLENAIKLYKLMRDKQVEHVKLAQPEVYTEEMINKRFNP